MNAARFLDPVDADYAWSLVELFAKQPREKPDDANRGAEIIAEKLREREIPVTMHEPRLFLSLPGPASVTLGDQRYVAKPPAFSASIPEGITARMEYMPPTHREFARYACRDRNRYRGRIVVTEGISLPMLTSEIEEMGAIGIIAVNPGERIHWSTASTIWGTPGFDDVKSLPRIPCVAVNRSDGANVIAAAKAHADVTICATVTQGWFTQKLPTVHIPGSIEPDRFVFLHGHYDSWDVGVGDNGTGNACMLDVARALWQRRRSLRRSVRLAWWPAHSTGRYGGSVWYLDAHASEFERACVIHMNCDSPGCAGATQYESIVMMPETVKAVQAIVERVTGQKPKPKRPNRSSDYSFYNIGISGAFMASSMMPAEEVRRRGWHRVGGCGGNIAWHTEDDQLAVADKEILTKDIALYLEAVTTFADAEILPFDFRDCTAELSAIIDGHAAYAAKYFDLSDVQAAMRSLSDKVERFHKAIEAGKIKAKDANDTMLALSRALVPLNYARGGRYRQDPAVTFPPVPLLSIAADLAEMKDDMIGFALADLMRGRNAALAAIEAASRAVDRVL